jgi:hypothetical protein
VVWEKCVPIQGRKLSAINNVPVSVVRVRKKSTFPIAKGDQP